MSGSLPVQTAGFAPDMEHQPPLASGFVLKVAGRCNLDCGYCYMYNKGDSSFRLRPKFMSTEVVAAVLRRIADYAQRHQLPNIALALHGGEPLLVGRRWVSWFFEEAQRISRQSEVAFTFAVQTNGTLLDQAWLGLFAEYDVRVGVSCDGPPHWHDKARPDRAGRGSYIRVRRALDLLAASYTSHWGVLTVADPGIPGREILQHFAEIGIPHVDFLWPDFHHDDRPPWPPGTLGRYFTDLFDFWYDELGSKPRVRWFASAVALLLGGDSTFDALGPQPLTDIMVESDGSWEPLDVLRICGDGFTRTGLDALQHDVEAIWNIPLYAAGLRNQSLLPSDCRSCGFREVCGGGYLPHRYDRQNGFANSSVHCADLRVVLSHIRDRLACDLSPFMAHEARHNA
jgi:uncharacterized protein